MYRRSSAGGTVLRNYYEEKCIKDNKFAPCTHGDNYWISARTS